MKNVLIIIILQAINLLAIGQVTLSVNNFDFSGSLTSNGWTAHSGGGTNPINTTLGLSFTNYSGSGVGNAVQIGNASGEDINKTFPSQSGNNTSVYASFMVNVNEASTSKTGDYFFHLGDPGGASWTLFSARVFARVVSGNVNFGLSNTNTATYSATNFSRNTTYLIILKYTIATGTSNDAVSMWVFSDGNDFSTEPLTSAAEVNNTTTNGTDNISAIGLRQGSSTNSPSVIVDGIRIAQSWDRVLPVAITSFTCSKIGKANNLTWSTASEQNNSGFNIERSTNGTDFENIGFVKSLSPTGNSSSRLDYSFTDYNPIGLNQYYRLKQTDFDGTSKYSAIVMVIREAPAAFTLTKVYPNPANSSIYISASVPTKMDLQFLIIDVAGRVVARKNVFADVGNNGFDISVEHLESGTYFFKAISKEQGVMATEKFIKF